MALLAEAENQTVGMPLRSGFLPAWVGVGKEVPGLVSMEALWLLLNGGLRAGAVAASRRTERLAAMRRSQALF